MPPPIIDIISMIAHLIPAADRSVFPSTDINIISPTNAMAQQPMPTASSSGDCGRTSKKTYATASSPAATVTVVAKQASPFPQQHLAARDRLTRTPNEQP